MKYVFTILFSYISLTAVCFDYPSYAKRYIDEVNEEVVGDGLCMDLVQGLFSDIEDSMLVDVKKMVWGSPVYNMREAQTGDIIIFGNHIVVVYSNDGELLIADQNRKGDSSGVKIHPINPVYVNMDNFQIFRPINLKSVPLYQSGESKATCLRLFTIHILDDDRVARSQYYTKKGNTIRPYFIDTAFAYTVKEYDFARYYRGKVYCDVSCYIKTPKGDLFVVETDWKEWKPIN